MGRRTCRSLGQSVVHLRFRSPRFARRQLLVCHLVKVGKIELRDLSGETSGA